MAETSGFFQAMADETTGEPDRRYLAKQFCDYFALFIGNGVFGSPTNQLIVAPGQGGLSVVVKPGNAFIDGMWYNNSSDKQIFIVPNYESQVRVDTVRVRMSQVTRAITAEVFTGDSDLQRGEDIYDLQLATINVQPFAETISAANIKDTRPDQSVCGFVTGLMSVQTTADLFAQYQAQFEEWFEGVQGVLDGDAAGNLLNLVNGLDSRVSVAEQSLSEVGSDIEETNQKLDTTSSSLNAKITNVEGQVTNVKKDVSNLSTKVNSNTADISTLETFKTNTEAALPKKLGFDTFTTRSPLQGLSHKFTSGTGSYKYEFTGFGSSLSLIGYEVVVDAYGGCVFISDGTMGYYTILAGSGGTAFLVSFFVNFETGFPTGTQKVAISQVDVRDFDLKQLTRDVTLTVNRIALVKNAS